MSLFIIKVVGNDLAMNDFSYAIVFSMMLFKLNIDQIILCILKRNIAAGQW